MPKRLSGGFRIRLHTFHFVVPMGSRVDNTCPWGRASIACCRLCRFSSVYL